MSDTLKKKKKRPTFGVWNVLAELQLGCFLFPMAVMHCYSFCYCFTKNSL